MATRYVDNTKETGTLTGANWQFTNASTTVTETGAAGNALAELAVNNYVRTNGGSQWYKVTQVTDDDNFEITPAFQQGTNTDTCKYNSEDGTAIAQAFCHLNQATTDEVRAAGDIIKLRANQTHTYDVVYIHVDESGSASGYITIKGCDSVDDPWSDGSDVRPIIDFALGTSYLWIDQDYWKLEHLDFKGGANQYGVIEVGYDVWHLTIDDCRFYDNGTAASHHALTLYESHGFVKDSTFDNNFGLHIDLQRGSIIHIEGCTFDGDTVGGGNGTDVGVFARPGVAFIKDSTFGVTDDMDTADIAVTNWGIVRGRNVKLDSATEVLFFSNCEGYIYLEDDEQTHEAFRAWMAAGNLTRTTAVNRAGAGGSPWSILGEPASICGDIRPLYLIGDWLRGVPIYLDGTQQTITVYAYATSWAALPTVSQFVVELEHYEGAADWEIDATADTFAANDQWESFAITLTPGDSGPAYLRVYLKDYEDGTEKVYVDPEPVIT